MDAMTPDVLVLYSGGRDSSAATVEMAIKKNNIPPSLAQRRQMFSYISEKLNTPVNIPRHLENLHRRANHLSGTLS